MELELDSEKMQSNRMGTIAVRFLLFPNGQEYIFRSSDSTSFAEIKKQLLQEWPPNFGEIETVGQLKFIHSGKVIQDEQTLKDVFKPDNNGKNEPVTIHVFIRKPADTTPSTTASTQNVTSTPNTSGDTTGVHTTSDIHVHASLFGEEGEVAYLKQIFDKKKGDDGKIALVELYTFLKTYWHWLAETGHISANREFPSKRFFRLKKKYVGDGDRVTCEQFVTIYFLVDSKTSRQQCPHGIKELVHRAAVELHRNLNPPCHWEQSRFETLFSRCDKDADGILSCRELDLFLYLYQLLVTDPSLLS